MLRWFLLLVVSLGLSFHAGCVHLGGMGKQRLKIGDWDKVDAVFSERAGLPFKQHWQPAASPNFAPGTVKLFWEAEALVVYAQLDDADIISTNTTFNAPFFTGCDAFEIFLRPEGQDAYVELHVGAQNQKMQLKIDQSEAFYKRRYEWPPVEELIAPYLISEPVLESHTRIREDKRGWETIVRIPFDFLSDGKNDVVYGTPLYGSFCRYDYTAGEKEPVYSSTSSLGKLDFHLQDFWDVFFP